ncbi:hypothetical protein IFM89_024520 [Coptis chinensis]|uniref:BRCT domain-containing protein n=1 Tax=Coptis chinensis TaxID=261450 RepID=A0A835LSP0_9MAGN|nr:hypothetical protein IFM89_024520 [Coptis chinensis]
MQEDYKTSTPVACIVVEIRRNKKRPSNLGVDAPKPSNEEDKSIQRKPWDCGSHEKIARASYEVRDAQRYHGGVRTRQSKSNLINGVSNADALSISILGSESYRQFLDRQELEVSCNDVKSVKKRKGRSSAHCNISSLSPEKNSERRLIRQPVPEQAISVAADNSSLAVMSERVVPKGTPTETLSTRSVKDCSGNHVSPTGGAEANASLDASPAGKANLSGTACVTPTNCTTPIHAASPVCIGNGYHKQSCRKKISRSSLVIELTRLDSNEISLSNSPASKDLRKRRDLAGVRALFSHHLDEDVIRQQKKILVRLGALTACSSSEATHFVTDKFVRTRNMLEAIASGKPVVTHLWLESCGQASCFIDERNYILRDYKKEKDIGFSMQVSLARASQNPLLESKRVFITPNVKLSMELVAILVKAVHGQAVERLGRSVMKDYKVPDDLLVLSCEEDFAICMPLLEKGVMIYGSELLLNGIVIQKLEYERHRLFTDHVRRTRSTIWLRKGDGHQFFPVTKCK